MTMFYDTNQLYAYHVMSVMGGEGAGLVPWVGGPPDASFGFT